MPDSIRLQILKAVQDRMIAVPGVGDTGGPKKMPTEINRYPALFVQPGRDVPVKYIGDSIDRSLDVTLIIWIRTQGSVLNAIEAFLPEVQRTMAADHTLGGLCTDFSEPEEGEGVSEPFPLDESQPDVGVTISYRCAYRVRRDNPYSRT